MGVYDAVAVLFVHHSFLWCFQFRTENKNESKTFSNYFFAKNDSVEYLKTNKPMTKQIK